ncbi:transposase [Candidatus Methylospira mobilis]|uniref:Transposase n=1 Tax=Candidatus Methylospira mobilis TaxID=1808979 RepID=A0A5Q0BPV6_9GAMM|nr:transposase [Candidatus Methylospira mobilis]
MKQVSFAALAKMNKKRKIEHERFLDEMKAVVPWPILTVLIEPHYPKADKGRHPRDLETMLRIYFMQRWFALSDPGMEDAFYDVPYMRAFVRMDLLDESMPDETTILNFRMTLLRSWGSYRGCRANLPPDGRTGAAAVVTISAKRQITWLIALPNEEVPAQQSTQRQNRR